MDPDLRREVALQRLLDAFDSGEEPLSSGDDYRHSLETAIALKRAHEESKPTVLEIFTYRYFGHSMADPDKTYREKEEIKEYREKKDPVLAFEQELLREKVLTPELSQKINEAAMAEALTGASRAAVQRNLAWMEAQGLIREVTGQGRYRMWRAAN